jgi:hypothetical protein
MPAENNDPQLCCRGLLLCACRLVGQNAGRLSRRNRRESRGEYQPNELSQTARESREHERAPSEPEQRKRRHL